MGKADGRGADLYCRHTDHPAMADPGGAAPEALLAAPEYVGRGGALAHPVGLGHFLRAEVHLAKVAVHKISARPFGVCLDLKDLPANVCGYRDCHRQRPGFTLGAMGAMAGETLPAAVCGHSHARLTSPGGVGPHSVDGAERSAHRLSQLVTKVLPSRAESVAEA